MRIHNLPNYAKNAQFIVARIVDKELWFYGAYDDAYKAHAVAAEIDGIAITVLQSLILV